MVSSRKQSLKKKKKSLKRKLKRTIKFQNRIKANASNYLETRLEDAGKLQEFFVAHEFLQDMEDTLKVAEKRIADLAPFLVNKTSLAVKSVKQMQALALLKKKFNWGGTAIIEVEVKKEAEVADDDDDDELVEGGVVEGEVEDIFLEDEEGLDDEEALDEEVEEALDEEVEAYVGSCESIAGINHIPFYLVYVSHADDE